MSSASNRYTFTDLRLLPGAEVTLFSGDTVFFRNDDGNIVASRSYGESG